MLCKDATLLWLHSSPCDKSKIAVTVTFPKVKMLHVQIKTYEKIGDYNLHSHAQ